MVSDSSWQTRLRRALYNMALNECIALRLRKIPVALKGIHYKAARAT